MEHEHNCWNCKQDTVATEYCQSCHKILPLVENVDYFSFLGLKKQLDINLDDLEKKFFDLSRKYHPDYYSNGDEIEKEISIDRSAFLNSAYKILKDPIERAKYLLKLEWGEIPKEDKKVPPEILMEVMELQERLEQEKSEKDPKTKDSFKEELKKIKEDLNNKLENMNSQLHNLFKEWDAQYLRNSTNEEKQSILKNISKNLSIRAYLNTLFTTFDN
jgi:molecular chaperone HscB